MRNKKNYNNCPKCNGQAKSIAGSCTSYDGWSCLDCGFTWDETGIGTEPMPAIFEVDMMYGGAFYNGGIERVCIGEFVFGGIKRPTAFLVKDREEEVLKIIGGWGSNPIEQHPILKEGAAEYIMLSNGVIIWAHSLLDNK